MRIVSLFLISIVTLYANVGNLSGNLSVNNGALNYNVPLKLPAGIAGHTPQVSLNYNSNTPNAYFGSGWSLTGLSTISRCGSNLEFDGKVQGIAYSSSDNICLDGQRLVLKSGTKWSAGSEYRTKIDSYSKITYDGTKFTVYTKAGDIKEYTLINQTWYLSTIKDRFDNTITYNYTSTSSEVYLDTITYTDYTIKLNYEDKLDTFNGYSGGYNTQITKRVSSINIKNISSILRTYNLDYKTQSSAIDKSLLESVEECVGTNCLEPLSFTYNEDNGVFDHTKNKYPNGLNFGELGLYPLVTGDFNGDGLTDIYRYKDNFYYIMLSNGDGTFTSIQYRYDNDWNFGSSGTYPVITGDFNGDGLTDIYRYKDNFYYIMLSNGNGTFNSIQYRYDNDWNFGSSGTYPVITGDFNGDGLTDIYRYKDNFYYIMLSNGDGTFTSIQYRYDNDWNFGSSGTYPVITGDFNGDGLTDIYRYKDNFYYIMLSNGDGTFTSIQYRYDNDWNFGSSGTYPAITGDFNGDGLTDIYRYKDNFYYIMLSNGDGTFTSIQYRYDNDWNFGSSGTYPAITGDFNGDSLTDIYRYKDNFYYVMLSTGNGTFTSIQYRYDNNINFGEASIWPAETGDFNGDGLTDIHRYRGSDYHMIISNYNKVKIKAISDSFNNQINITYKHLTDDSIYIKHNDGTYPNIDTQNSMQVVSSVVSKTASGEDSTTTYTYEGLKTNLKGLGSLGFAKITSVNDLNNIKTETSYNQTFPYIGMVDTTTTYMDEVPISEVTNTYSNSLDVDTYKIYLDKSVSKNYNNGVLLSTATNENTSFDDYGNILSSISTTVDNTTSEEFKKTITNTYTNDTTNWILARLTNATVISEAYSDSQTKTSSFTYDATTGILLSETIEPNNPKALTKTYTYDTNGNRLTSTISGSDITSATTTYGYDQEGKYNTTITNALGHIVTKTYDAEGKVLSITDPNNLITSFTYDNFGKKLSETRADGTNTTYSYILDSSVTNSYYKIEAQSTGVGKKTTYYNSLGMPVATSSVGFDNKTIITSQTYDKFGNVVEKVKPHYEGEDSQSIYYTYDRYNRLKQTDSPGENGRVINTLSYNGFKTTATNPKNQSKTTTKNVLGKVVKIEEPLNATIFYTYDALGNLIQTKDSANITITLAYDKFGNKTSQNDPDMGNWSYTYNSLGKLISQSDAKGQVTNISYDTLGRKISETLVGDSISTWIYDTTKKGKLNSEKKEDLSGNTLFEKTYTYDNFSRLVSSTTTIDSKTFTKTYAYDTNGRVENKTLPNGFELINTYDSNGYLVSIKSPKNQIADFNRDHFYSLIQSTLTNSETLYRNSIEYLNEANDLYVKVDDYRYIANLSTISTSDAAQLNDIADQLEANANALKFEAEYYKKQSDAHKTAVDGYLAEALNSNSINGINELEDFYSQLHTIYNTYSANILSIAAQYVNHAVEQSNTSETVSYYLSISTEALDEATTAAQKADNFESLAKGYSSSENELVSYQDILSDENYNYFYKVLKYNAYNQVVSYLSGNGLVTNTNFNNSGAISNITTGYNHDDGIRNLEFTYDDLGNLLTREDSKLNTTHTYTYDDLNRVDDVQIVTASSSESISYTYDVSGNITNKSDIGNYTYNPDTHQVSQAGTKAFTYDANGNVVTNSDTTFSYTPFNKPSSITTSNNTISFYYDMNKKRYKNTKSTDSSTTYYVDKVYENTTTSASADLHRYFIYVNGQVVAIYNSSTSNSSTKYLHYDSLNSVDTITTNLGVVESRMAYKPFGKKLNLDSNGNEVTTAPFTNRGYTGHEHIEGTDFIHMNARVYDSSVARFMSADLLVVHPLDTQDFNRYSYTKNNPLKYVDPSGHGWKKVVRSVAKKITKAHLKVFASALNPLQAAEDAKKEIRNFESTYRNEMKMVAIATIAASTGGAVAGLVTGSGWGAAIVASTVGGAVSGATVGYLGAHAYDLDKSEMLQRGFEKGAVNGLITGMINNSNVLSDYTIKEAKLKGSLGLIRDNLVNKDLPKLQDLRLKDVIEFSSSISNISNSFQIGFMGSGNQIEFGTMTELSTEAYRFYNTNRKSINEAIEFFGSNDAEYVVDYFHYKGKF